MTVVGMSTLAVVWAWIGLALGVGALCAVLWLFQRIVNAAREIRAYADQILDGGLGIARNVDGLDELARTQALARAVPGLGAAYLGRMRRR